ncbi:UDP-glucose/GDP-mannose dehydrogenase family protein [Rothia sp. AR01]|uniref:UDP-glucose 6-dehydrogenase n=1 Tax=Rothia santali TaxID=2949643 RepID=A0A9X2HG91_9MICC|nr:UDP-glucose/GDP-mannose dehydrogenase family protein [Rothia santali]MCP3426182.1 UDP-glucose/GDP-mannose dehydrogenase family protein [Rothia santali]
MRIAIFGSGYVGLVTGACLADGGHHVTCVDVDSERVARLRAGESPIWEPGLEELLRGNLAQGRLEFTDDPAEALEDARVAFVAVGTPQAPDGSADLSYVDDVARRIGELARRDLLVVNKSTVPVGTAARVRALIEEGLAARGAGHRVGVASNPEFLKEGAAIADFKHGDRIVVGTEAAEDEELLRLVYEPFNRQREKIIAMDIPSAELTKYAANAMLAAKISFMNEIAAISEAAGADIERVRQGIGSDPRIGYQFLYAGAGYGGSCFPKDVAALAHTARQAGCEPRILDAVEAVNAHQKGTLLRRLDELLPGLAGRTVAVWGLAFKPRTDDVREAPALHLVRGLLAAGCTVRAYDPVAAGTFAAALGEEAARVEFTDSALDAARGADALAICTEWEEFRAFDAEGLAERMAGRLIVDGRNLYDPARVAAAGFAYASVGRRTAGLPAEEGAGQPPAGSPSRAAIPASIRS